MQIADGVGEEAELIGFVPHAVLDILPVGEEMRASAGSWRRRVPARCARRSSNIGDRDAVVRQYAHVHHVVTRGATAINFNSGSCDRVSARIGTLLTIATVAPRAAPRSDPRRFFSCSTYCAAHRGLRT